MANYNTKLVSKVTGASPRQMEYWDRTGLVKPSVQPAVSKGIPRLYSFTDLIQIKTVATLREEGISLQKIRRCIAYLKAHLPEIERPLAELRLLTDGETIFVLTDDPKVVVDTLQKGQLVWSFAIGKVVQEVREEVEKLRMTWTETVRVGDFAYQVVLEPDTEDGGVVVDCPAIPGCASQGETREEALEMIEDAIGACLEVIAERKGAARATGTE